MSCKSTRTPSRIHVLILSSRGRKVYRRFDGIDPGLPDLGDTSQQRALKRAAGESAQRPLTRSQIAPRLLWPARPNELGIDEGATIRQHDTVDEEAETDIDMSDAPVIGETLQRTPRKPKASQMLQHATPAKVKTRTKTMISPPTTLKATRSKEFGNIPSFEETLEADDEASAHAVTLSTPQRSSRKKKVEINDVPIYRDSTPEPIAGDAAGQSAPAPPTPARARTQRVSTHLTPIVEDAEDGPYASPAQARTSGRKKIPSPFDNWPRTKAGRKREGDTIDAVPTPAATKRSRSGTRSAHP